jgi:hypothetical protein
MEMSDSLAAFEDIVHAPLMTETEATTFTETKKMKVLFGTKRLTGSSQAISVRMLPDTRERATGPLMCANSSTGGESLILD